jgi:hypothetical protein
MHQVESLADPMSKLGRPVATKSPLGIRSRRRIHQQSRPWRQLRRAQPPTCRRPVSTPPGKQRFLYRKESLRWQLKML